MKETKDDATRSYKKELYIRVFHENTFFKKIKSPTHQALAWGLVLEDPNGFLIFIKFRGASGHFRFDHFHIVKFHSAFFQPSHERTE